MSPLSLLFLYRQKLRGKIERLTLDMDPNHASSQGLANMSRALGLGGRFDIEDGWDGYRVETDDELRKRIKEFLRV